MSEVITILEPTQIPDEIHAYFQRKNSAPTFYGKMGDIYIVHEDDKEKDWCDLFFLRMIQGVPWVCCSFSEVPELLDATRELVRFIHEMEASI